MSEIRYSKENYDTKMSYLNYMASYIDVSDAIEVTSGNNISDTVSEYEALYNDLKTLVMDYVSALSITVQSLQNIGDAIYETDQNMSDSMGE